MITAISISRQNNGIECQERSSNLDSKLASAISGVEEDNVSESSSVDTEEAFMEMLGLTSLDLTASSSPCWDETGDENDDENDDDDSVNGDENENEKENDDNGNLKQEIISTFAFPKIIPINLPRKASRHHYHPSSCLALTIDGILSPSDCQKLIHIATKKSSFRYIKEATHKTADGSSYTVQIQNPNPHKLAVIDTRHSPYYLPYSQTPPSQPSPEDFPTLLMDHLFDSICKALYSLPKRQSQPQQQQPAFFDNFVSRERCGKPKGLNPRMRILKYDASDDDRFEPHFDATTYIELPLEVSSTVTSTSTTEMADPGSLSSDENDGKDYHPCQTPTGKQQNNRKNRLKSLITVLVYLNDGDGEDFDGGETVYLDYHDSTATATTTANTHHQQQQQHLEKIVPKVGRIVLFEHDLFHSGAPLSWGTKYVMRTDILFEEEISEEERDSCCDSSRTSSNFNSDQDNEAGSSIAKEFILIHDVCDELNISTQDMQILDEMGLLHNITCESFLSPGITHLSRMLVDGGMEKNIIDSLIQRAFEVVQTQ